MNAQEQEQHENFKLAAEWLCAEVDRLTKLHHTPENVQRGLELMYRCEQLQKEIHQWSEKK